MSERKDTPKKCPACNGSFVTETLNSWICADCGATKEKPVSRKNRETAELLGGMSTMNIEKGLILEANRSLKSISDAINGALDHLFKGSSNEECSSLVYEHIVHNLTFTDKLLNLIDDDGYGFSNEFIREIKRINVESYKISSDILKKRDANKTSGIYELNDGHIIEALDRIHVSIEYLDCALKNHPLLGSVAEFDNEINKAIDILAELYQRVGSFDDVNSISDQLSLSEGYKVKQ